MNKENIFTKLNQYIKYRSISDVILKVLAIEKLRIEKSN